MDIKLVHTVDVDNPDECDLMLVGGDFVFVKNPQVEIEQTLRARLEFFKGEWYRDANEGTPYYQKLLFLKDVTDELIRSIIGNVITESPGIKSLDSFSVDRDNNLREARINFTATMDGGYVLDSSKLAPFVVRL